MYNQRRIASLGISAQTVDRITAQMNRIDAVGNRVGPNIDKWTDTEAASRFIGAISPWVNTSGQTNNIGVLANWMTTPVARTIVQCWTFSIGTYDNMLLRGFAVRDATEAAIFMTSTMIAAVAWVGQTHLRSVGRDDQEDDLNEHLAGNRIASAVARRVDSAPTRMELAPCYVPALTRGSWCRARVQTDRPARRNLVL